jgi:soluble lytic murein transglycosylase-like protein
LFLSTSEQQYVDVATDSIASFEKEEPSVADLSKPGPAGPSTPDLDEMVERVARENQLDPEFIRAVIGAESRGKVAAVSPKGAQGLMQLMPETAARLGVKNAFDSAENLSAGTKYLRALLARYHNDPVRALAAYNAGTGRVQQYHGLPPFRETRAYVAGIIRDFNDRKLAQRKTPVKKTVRSFTGNHYVDGN